MKITLRTRLVLLLMVGLVPLLGLSLVKAWSNAQAAISMASRVQQNAISMAAAHQERVLESARQILMAIASAPGLVEGKSADCGRYLGTLKDQFPLYATLGVIGLDGYMLCHSEVNRPLGFFGDRKYFQTALARGSFVAGGHMVSRATGKPVIVFARPVTGREEKVTAVAFVTVNLSEISKVVAAETLPPGSQLVIADRQGLVLAANPEKPALIGQRVPSPFLQNAVKTMRTGAGEGPDGQGIEQLFAFMPIGTAADAPFFAAISSDRAGVLLPVWKELGLEFTLMALLAFLGGLMAWRMGARAIVAPTEKILEATRQIGQGGLDVRIPISAADEAGEFSRIAAGFNRMAESLQRQHGELASGLARSQAAQEKLQDAQRLGRIGYWQSNLDTRTVWWSDEVYDVLGVDRALLGNSYDEFLQWVHPDDREAYGSGRDGKFRSGLPRNVEFRVITSAGEVRWIHQFGRAHVNAEGEQGRRRAGVIQDITVQHEAQVQMRLLETCIAHLNDMVVITEVGSLEEPGTRIIFVNDAFERRTGYGRQEVLGRSPRFLRGPNTQRAALDRIREARKNGRPIRVELINYTKSGQAYWVELDIAPIADATGRFAHWVAVERDITERKLAEQALIDSEQRYAALFEAAPVPMFVFAIDTHRFLTVNNAAVRGFGYSVEEFLSMTLFDIHQPAQHDLLRQKLSEETPRRQGTWSYRRKDGSDFPAESVSQTIQHTGQAARFVVALDITAQAYAQKEVAEHLFTLQRSADAAQAITWHQTLQGTLQEVAEQARGVIGAHQAAVSLTVGGDWAQAIGALSLSEKYAQYRDLIEPMDGSGIHALVSESNRGLRMTQAELEAHPRWRGFGSYAGKHPPMRGWLAVPLTARDGKNIGLLQLSDKYEGEFTQVDEYVAMELAQLASSAIENARLIEEVGQLNRGLEQKVAERTAALARQEAMFRALSDQAPQVVWMANQKGAVTYVNHAWFDLVGGTVDDWGGDKWLDVIHPEDWPEVEANWRAASTDLSLFSGIRRLRAKDGSYHTMAYRASPVLDEQGKVLFWVGIDADISEVKVIEAALRLANQELESFSYSVSHDLRSPLNTIDGFSQLLAKHLAQSDDDKVRHYLSRIRAGTAQMGQLIGDLLALAQVSRVQMQREPVDLSALARCIADDLQARQPSRQVALQIESGLQAQADAGLLRVVLGNLLGNAWKFSSKQLQTEISIGQQRDAKGETVFFVRDNGAGFDMAYADKLFLPFQRLHAVAEFAGTGIGLATVKRVIERHGGRLWADAAPGRGATFFFTLPKGAAVV